MRPIIEGVAALLLPIATIVRVALHLLRLNWPLIEGVISNFLNPDLLLT